MSYKDKYNNFYLKKEITMKKIVGVDISSLSLDTCILCEDEKEYDAFKNNNTGINKLIEWAKQQQIQLVIMEATGGYEDKLVKALNEASIPFYVANPIQIRQFAKGIGKLSKTDKIDSYVIARFGQIVKPEPRELASEVEVELKNLTLRRVELVEMIKSEKNRLRLSSGGRKKSIQRHINMLEKELENINGSLNKLVEKDSNIDAKIKCLTKIKGIGNVIAITLVAFLPELGKVNRKQIASLGGTAPITRESGKWKGKSFISGGRPQVRRALYMAALVAMVHNKDMRNFYNKLITANKPKKVAITAVMRKLLVICNAIIKDYLNGNID